MNELPVPSAPNAVQRRPNAAAGETSLIEAARDGDLLAWEQIVRRHQELVFRHAYLVTRGSSSAEETTEAAFIRAYRALPSLSPGTALRPWLMRITAGVARTRRRGTASSDDRSRHAPSHLGPRVPPAQLGPGAPPPMLATDDRDALVSAFDRLAEDDRLLIASRYLLGLSRDEVAARLDILPAEVDQRLRHATLRLRSRLGAA